MIKVYIASPYTLGDVKRNVEKQIEVSNLLRITNENILPYWPLSSHYWNELYEHDYNFWMKLCLDWLMTMDCVLRLEGESKGADKEVLVAKRLGIPVFYSIEKLLEYVRYETEVL